MNAYLDTSAAMKLIVREAESGALLDYLRAYSSADAGVLAASWLLYTELHCAARRHRRGSWQERVDETLERVALVDLTRADLLAAASQPYGLGAADAIHLAVALRLTVDSMITYDADLQDAARAAGLTVTAPG